MHRQACRQESSHIIMVKLPFLSTIFSYLRPDKVPASPKIKTKTKQQQQNKHFHNKTKGHTHFKALCLHFKLMLKYEIIYQSEN